MMRRTLRLALASAWLALAADPAAAAEDLPGKFTQAEAPAPAPEVAFEDAQGRALGLDAFRGKWTLVNFWATWCAPCRAEMKDLDELQAELGGGGFVVVAISADRQGLAAVEPFYDEIGIERLAIYLDKSMKSARAFRAVGLPTTVLLDPEGREVGRAVGPVAWASEASVDYLKRLIDGDG